jgi:Carboxypeptidase regulatory-like domain/TonB dependent receptor/TonB-dependent Receptor Plug Domain
MEESDVQILKKLILGCAAFGIAALAWGQGITTGTVQGAVVDPSGAVVVGGQIELENTASGLALSAHSGSDGAFKFLSVPIGTYKVVINAQSFTPETVNNVIVQAGATTNLNQVTLRIGTAEQVEVNGSGAVLLETTDSQVTTTFATETIQNLPLNNGFDTVAEVIPGVVSTGGRTYGDGFTNNNGDNFSVNGQSGRYNNFEIDGQSNNDNSIGGPSAFFGSQDAIEEIQVITNDYSAQYGRNAGAVVNYITKSGSNTLHGSAFEFYQGQFLSSLTNYEESPNFGFCPPGVKPSSTNPCNPPSLPRYVENRYGGTLGGPILNNKLFFFGSTYWDPVRPGAAPAESLPLLTPDPNGLAQLQAAFPGAPGVAALVGFGPYAVKQGNPQPIASSVTTEAVTGPNGQTVNVEFAGVVRNIVSVSNDQEELGRLDWQPTDKDHLFLRYFYQPTLSTGVAGPYGGGTASGDFVNAIGLTHSVGADWTHNFTTHFIDQLRYSFQDSNVFFQGGAYPHCVTTDFAACPTDVIFIGGNNDLNFGGDLIFPQGRAIKTTQVQNNATWTRGSQTLLFGGEFDYENSPSFSLYFYNGALEMGTMQDFIQNGAGGTGAAQLANGDTVVPFTEPDIGVYFQDDWKTTPTLTLHLGVRWEFFGQAVNKLHDETVARESNPNTAIWPTTLPLADRTTGLASQHYLNFEPRIGLAWNPEFDRKFVVRAGYAINANPTFDNMFTLEAGGAPVVNTGLFGCGSGDCIPSNGSLLSTDFRTTNLPFLPTQDPRLDDQTTFPSNFRTPYVQTYTLAVDHQLGGSVVGEARYVGSKTTDDFQSIDANPYLLPVAEAFPNYALPALCTDTTANGYGRLNCNNSNVAEITNGGWANYNGLQLNLNAQNYHGLSSTVSYTWSKSMNNATDAFRSTGSGGSTSAYSQNPLSTDAAERGLSGNDFTNAVGLQFIYSLPGYTRGSAWLTRVTSGFMLSGLYRFTSGIPYTPYQPLNLDSNNGDSSFCDGVFNASTVGPDLDTCRLVLSNKKAPVNTVAYLNAYTGGQDANGNPLPGTPEYVVYGSDGYSSAGVYSPGTPVDPASTHWIINNQAYALSVHNPYPGSSRSPLRGPDFSELDATVTKTTKLTERVSMQLSLSAYNALNQYYLGPGAANVSSSVFTSNIVNFSGTSTPGDSSGNRFMILGGKFIF